MRSTLNVVLLSALGLSASSLALADTLVSVKSEIVNFSDLRLSSRVGAAVLYGRLHNAAERACAPFDGTAPAAKVRFKSCIDGALSMAVTDVNHPLLTEYYESKKRTPSAADAAAVPSISVVAKTP